MDLKKDIFEKAKTFIMDPKTAFDRETKSDAISGLKYAVIWLFIMALLSAIVYGIFGNRISSFMTSMWLPESVMEAEITVGSTLSTFFGAWIGGVIGLLILGLWLHLWAYILGARMKLENTLKVVFYGNTPSYVLGWIPLLNVIATIWALVLYIMGLTRLQKLTTGKAILTLVIAILIPGIIVGALVIMFIGLMSPLNTGLIY